LLQPYKTLSIVHIVVLTSTTKLTNRNQHPSMKAIKIKTAGTAVVVTDAKKPELKPDYLLVKTHAVALNPTDWKHVGFVNDPVVVGCDWAGVVEEVGSQVTKSFKKGDRVYGVNHGSNQSAPEGGSFGDYLVSKGDLTLKIPDGMDFTDAAALGMGISTVGQGLYQALGLPLPDQPAKEKFSVLIYGGGSAMGAYAIQFAVA
jgi:NADPH:quinone reductase-like Zn-dependent oxidoreductase